jgi:hypothetical protein
VSWRHGFLPGTSVQAARPGPFFGASDASVAYDARDRVWMISWLGAHFSGGGVVDVMTSRSTDGGLTWDAPVVVAASGVFYDKNWSVCDNTARSPFYGHCYTEFDNASNGDLEQMSTSTDGGLTWGTPQATADQAHGLGGQPLGSAQRAGGGALRRSQPTGQHPGLHLRQWRGHLERLGPGVRHQLTPRRRGANVAAALG